eukprot:g287.t1
MNRNRSASFAARKQAKQEDEARQMQLKRKQMNPVKLWAVELVNPKFVRFNRPMILAGIVATLTLAAVIAYYVAVASNCEETSITVNNYYEAMKTMKKINDGGEKMVRISKQVLDRKTYQVTLEECLPRSRDLGKEEVDSAIQWAKGSTGGSCIALVYQDSGCKVRQFFRLQDKFFVPVKTIVQMD